MIWRNQSFLVYTVWAILVAAFVISLAVGRWSMAFVSTATLIATILPGLFASRLGVRLPVTFITGLTLFIFATLFLGEAIDFYDRYWWWDVFLHGTSAVGFGMVGFVFIFVLFEGDRYAAPAWAITAFAWCFAVAIGAVWEIFEYAMDQSFGLNMQKSGLQDTMWDLIVDVLGAIVGAGSGYLYLKGLEDEGPPALISEFVRLNRRLFSRVGRKR